MAEERNDIEELLGTYRRANAPSAEGHRERVRESVDRNPDFAGFNEYQMLEWLLFATIARKDTKAIAKELLRTFGSLSAVLHADYYELVRVKDVGEKTAHLLAHILPVVLRAEYNRYNRPERLTTAASAAWYLYTRFLGQTKEILLVTSLNVNDEIIQTDEITEGTVDSAAVDVMKILRIADRNGAKKIILSHNHPGGTMSFSDADMETTARVVACCMMTGFTFYDHLIFSGNKYLSMFGNKELDTIITLSRKLCTRMSAALTAEKTKMQMLSTLQLGERGATLNSNQEKIEILNAYKQLLAFGNEKEREAVFNSLVQTVSKPQTSR
jgi:DNA repair protein RadC